MRCLGAFSTKSVIILWWDVTLCKKLNKPLHLHWSPLKKKQKKPQSSRLYNKTIRLWAENMTVLNIHVKLRILTFSDTVFSLSTRSRQIRDRGRLCTDWLGSMCFRVWWNSGNIPTESSYTINHGFMDLWQKTWTEISPAINVLHPSEWKSCRHSSLDKHLCT